MQNAQEFFKKNFPQFESVFDPRVYKDSTLKRKKCHLSLFARFIKTTIFQDSDAFTYGSYIASTNATDLLINLKEWSIQLALSGLAIQTLRNYVETNFSYLCWMAPISGILHHAWGQAWMQIKMGVKKSDVASAPIYTREKHQKLTILGKLAAVLLYTGSLRFHALQDHISFVEWSDTYIDLEISAWKIIPAVFGIRKRIFCNCLCSEGQRDKRFCFPCGMRECIDRSILHDPSQLFLPCNIRFILYDFKRCGLTGHSMHRSVSVWMQRALATTSVSWQYCVINTFNNWNCRSNTMLLNYCEGFDRWSLEQLVPLNPCIRKAEAYYLSIFEERKANRIARNLQTEVHSESEGEDE